MSHRLVNKKKDRKKRKKIHPRKKKNVYTSRLTHRVIYCRAPLSTPRRITHTHTHLENLGQPLQSERRRVEASERRHELVSGRVRERVEDEETAEREAQKEGNNTINHKYDTFHACGGRLAAYGRAQRARAQTHTHTYTHTHRHTQDTQTHNQTQTHRKDRHTENAHTPTYTHKPVARKVKI